MAGIVLVGLPFLIGQGVGICADIALDVMTTSMSHLIVPIHVTCGILAVVVGIGWRTSTTSKTGKNRGGAPTAADYNKVMLVTLLSSLALSIAPYRFMMFVWDNIIYRPTLT